MRVGHGFDAHRFGPGDHVVIGGVKIPFNKGMIAHSDGDVLIHALCDALLGAAALGDIGRHFPDTSMEFKGIDSRVLLRRVVALLDERGFVLGNADITLVAQTPKMSPHVTEMVANLAADVQVEVNQINIKATTTEGMGYIGRGEGIACHVVVLIQPI